MKGQKWCNGGGRVGRVFFSGKGPRKGKRPTADAATVRGRKAKSRCRVCGQQGHWSGDPECPQQTRTVHIAEGDPPDGTEVLLCHTVSVQHCLQVARVDRESRTRHSDSCRGLWEVLRWVWFVRGLRVGVFWLRGLAEHVKRFTCDENYRLDDGRVVPSSEQVSIPACLGNRLVTLNVCLVPGSLTLSLGRDLMDRFTPTMDMGRDILKIGNCNMPLVRSFSGHYAVDLHPEKIHILKEIATPVGDALPRS
jgi:hypothetical protein